MKKAEKLEEKQLKKERNIEKIVEGKEIST